MTQKMEIFKVNELFFGCQNDAIFYAEGIAESFPTLKVKRYVSDGGMFVYTDTVWESTEIIKLRNQIIDTIKGIDRTETETTHWIKLEDDGDKIWAIVFGYIYEDEEWYMKVAYRNKRNIMCEYSFDWIMPTDKDDCVIDSELAMSEDVTDVDYIIDDWFMIKKEFVKEN